MLRHLLLFALGMSTFRCFAENDENTLAYGPNIVAATWVVTQAGNGPGLELERAIARSKSFTFLLSASYQSSRVDVGHFSNSIYFPLENITKEPTHLYLFRPGVRWYAGGYSGRFRYAAGFNLWLATGTGQGTTFYETGALYKGYPDQMNKVEERTMVGIVFSNSLHFHATPNIRLSVEAAVGDGRDTRIGYRASERVLNMSLFRNLSFMLACRF